MKIFSTFNNKQIEVALIKALARLDKEASYVETPGEADVIVLCSKGKGFGADDLDQYAKVDRPRVLVTDGSVQLEAGEVVKAVQEGDRLKVRVSEVAAAVKKLAPVEFIIEDDYTDEDEQPGGPAGASIKEATPAQPAGRPEKERGGSEELSIKDRLSLVLQKNSSEVKKKRDSELPAGEVQPRARLVVCGVKGGVGATTLSACLAHTLEDIGAVHREEEGKGHIYYGPSVEEAERSGIYSRLPGSAGLEIYDAGAGSMTGEGFMLLVTDDSGMGYEILKEKMKTIQPDLVAVRVRGGISLSVFEQEFPGTTFYRFIDDYKACIAAQVNNNSPTDHSADMSSDVGRIAAGVRRLIGR